MRGAVSVVLTLSLALGLAGCGGSSAKLAGEECTASSECADGLQCDFGSTPPVCSTENTRPDAPVDQPDGPPGQPDARVFDAPPGTPDAPQVPPDAMIPPDAALPDAAIPDADLPDA